MFTLNTYAQSHLNLEAHFLVGLQSQKELNQRKLSNSRYLGFDIGVNCQISIYKDLYAETGAYGKIVQSEFETELAHISSKTINLQIPILIGLDFQKWQYSAGLTFENNRNFEDMNINLPFNLRYYLTIKTSFQLRSKLQLSLSGNFNVSNVPESYLIVNPANYVSLGVMYNLI